MSLLDTQILWLFNLRILTWPFFTDKEFIFGKDRNLVKIAFRLSYTVKRISLDDEAFLNKKCFIVEDDDVWIIYFLYKQYN